MGISGQGRIICVFVAAILILCGMCFQRMEADTLFSCDPTGRITTISTGDVLVDTSDSCTQEMLGQQTIAQALGNAARGVNSTKVLSIISILFALIYWYVLLVSTGRSETTSDRETVSMFGNIRVTHRKDGKKRELLSRLF